MVRVREGLSEWIILDKKLPPQNVEKNKSDDTV